MIRFFFMAAMLMTGLASQAQAPSIEPTRRYESTVEYQKTQQKCTVLEFNYPSKDLDKAMEDYVRQMGGKVKSAGKGWNVAKGVKLHKGDNRYYDAYYKIDGSGKGDRASSSMTFILSEPGESLVATAGDQDSRAAVASTAGAAAFFGGMGATVGEYDQNKKISLQEDEIKKAQKKYDQLVNDGKNLESKRVKLDQDITDNSNAQATQQAEIERLKGVLEQIKSGKKVKDN
jgi:hypothetical protein